MNPFIAALSSALLSSAAAVAQKRILFRIPAIEFSFFVSVLILASLVFVPWTLDVTALPVPTLGIVVVKSLFGATAFLLVMLSLEHNQISTALPLLGTTPGVTALLALAVLGESLSAWEWSGVALMMFGTFLLERRPAGSGGEQRGKGGGRRYIYAAVALFAGSSVADRLLVGTLNTEPLTLLFYQHIVYVLLFGVLLRTRNVSLRKSLRVAKEMFPLIAVVALLTIAYRLAQLEATKAMPVALVLSVKRTSILFATLFGGKLFSEERLGTKLIGASLIVGSGFIILRNVG